MNFAFRSMCGGSLLHFKTYISYETIVIKVSGYKILYIVAFFKSNYCHIIITILATTLILMLSAAERFLE